MALIARVEPRGFLFGAAMAIPLDAGVLLICKDGRLSGTTIAQDYAPNIGATASLCMRSRARPARACCWSTA
ncbi:MAG: adenine phosphoribosyltransferase [Sphingomonas bacterium]|nr:adenine phosphoribosyltransferase [Sphingomonas bacterium]